MVEVLNSLNVHCSCVGNHDLDYGVDNLEKLTALCKFPWLLSNIKDNHTGEYHSVLCSVADRQSESCSLLRL